VRVTVTKARRSRSRPEQGVVHSFAEVLNQSGEVVMTVEADQPPPLPPGVAVGCSKRAGPTESSPRSN